MTVLTSYKKNASAKLYPEIQPYRTFRLPVDELHQLYVEEVGNPKGEPVVFLHGGPGGCVAPVHRRLFDPAHYRIILFDQRGAGQSTPSASLENNTTWHLVSDIEAIRTHLGIEKWLVFGGSWGSTLALAYAQSYSAQVSGLILRGIFLCTPEELRWFYQAGCHMLFPDFWQRYLQPIPLEERHDLIQAYYKRLTGPDSAVALACAKAWSKWEASTCHLLPDQKAIDEMDDPFKALAFARIECHYFTHHAFLEPNQLLRDMDKIYNIPTTIIHGRYDVICPVKNAWTLHQAMPEARLNIVPDAGHAFSEPGILKALLEAIEQFKTHRAFGS